MRPTLTLELVLERARKIEAIREDMMRVQDAKIGKPIEARYYKLCADFVQELAKEGVTHGDTTNA